MKTKIKQPKQASTMQSKTKAANQASIQKVLQKYKSAIQREEIPDENELLQGRFDPVAIQMKSRVINQSQDYDYGTGTVTVGEKMQAWLDPKNMPTGQSANLNTSQDEMMGKIRTTYSIVGGNVVKGHLLNDNMGGKALNNNLYPITKAANATHLNYIENAVKQRVWHDQLGVYYSVSVDATPDITSPEADFDCEIKEWNPKTNAIGADVMPPATIESDLRDVKSSNAFITHNGVVFNPTKRPKKPRWAIEPRKRVSELTKDEYDERITGY